MTALERQLGWVAIGARVFGLLAMGAPLLWGQQIGAFAALSVVGAGWLLAELAASRGGRLAEVTAAVEGAFVGIVCAVSWESPELLATLAVPPFCAALRRGVVGTITSISFQLLGLVVTLALRGVDPTLSEMGVIFTWSMTGLGLGLIASFLHAQHKRPSDPLAPYHYAQSLIRELIDLSGGLSSGLDPNTLGGAILSRVRDEVPTAALVLYVPRGDELAPMITKNTTGQQHDLDECHDLALHALEQRGTVVSVRTFAFPLRAGESTAAVVAGVMSDRLDGTRLDLSDRVRKLVRELSPSAVHLDTALLFAAFRDAATADERRRLSREMHDGVAQDIASVGYLVDALTAKTTDPVMRERMEMLRDRISAVVAEVRRSVIALRTNVGASESLGTALGALARNLSDDSHLPIEVVLDEGTARLRPEVEAELFRIAQEAMNNAVRHSECTSIRVQCSVHAPAAAITVIDDGRGLGEGRADSFGLKIMRERALLLGGDLELSETPGGGLTVAVSIDGPDRGPGDSSPVPADRDQTKVTA